MLQVFLALLAGIAALLAVFYGLWLLVPILSGLPWRPTETKRIRRALELARVQPGEHVYDLGSGDGRVLLMAAREFGAYATGAYATGIEISPLHCLVARWMAQSQHLSERISIRQGDFFKADLSDADVVFAYMTSREARRLRPHLEKQLHPGARVVTISFDFDGWQPDAYDNEGLIFLYQMPPTPGSVTTFLAKRI
jgi:SAM-dependent methyltransferase